MKKPILNRSKRAMLLFAILFPAGSADAASFVSNKATIDYEVQGSGAPVFVLHGGLTSREDLRLLIDHLATSHQVVALDSREQGRSSGSDLQISYDLMARDVKNLAQHLGLNDITLIGQSDGGITALTAAHAYPGLVARLVLIGTSFHHNILSGATKKYLRTTVWPAKMDRSRYPGMFLDDFLRGGRDMANYQTWFDELAHMWTTSPSFTVGDLSQVTIPTLVINGDREDVPLDHVLALVGAMAQAQLYIVPGATHFLHQEKPQLLHDAISRFLIE